MPKQCIIRPVDGSSHFFLIFIVFVSIRKVETELTPEFLAQKDVHLGVLVTIDTDKKINVEIQKKDEHNMRECSLFHWSKIFSGQAEVSERYKDLKRTICINILTFRLFEDERY